MGDTSPDPVLKLDVNRSKMSKRLRREG